MKASEITNIGKSTGAVLMRDFWKVLLIMSVVLLLPACSGDGLTGSGTTAGVSTACQTDPTLPQCALLASSITLRLSKQEVKSDGLDTVTVTATLLDNNNAAMVDVQVDFSTPIGKLSASIVNTDENGEASVEFSSGADPTNQVVFVSATVAGAGTATIPITIVGTTLTIQEVGFNKTIQIPTAATTASADVTIIATDAGGQFIYNQPITLTTNGPGVTFSAATVVTDTRGEATVTVTVNTTTASTTLTGFAQGEFNFIATGLGVVQTKVLQAQAQTSAFRITTPVDAAGVPTTPVLVPTQTQVIVVTVPNPGPSNMVRFAATIGTWVGAPAPGTTFDVAVAGGTATATLLAGTTYGAATVHVSDVDDPLIFQTMTVIFSPAVTDASQLILQSDVTTLPLSNSTTQFSTNVEAKVVTADSSQNFPVNNAPVAFTISRTTGGGEFLSESTGITTPDGIVNTKYTSGTTSSGQTAVTITASVIGSVPLISDTINITIGGTAGSVTVGTPRVILQRDGNDSINIYSMSALVADSAGNGISGQNVTLKLWPEAYLTGVWYDADIDVLDATEDWQTYITGIFTNEDQDEDLILDNPIGASTISEDSNQDGELTPPNSVAGTAPQNVTTLDDGTGPFEYVYLKDHAEWVLVRVTASTNVLGTEASTSTFFTPATVKAEVDDGRVSDSPFTLTLQHPLPLLPALPLVPDGILETVVAGTITPAVGGVAAVAKYSFPEFNTSSPDTISPVANIGGVSGRSFVVPAGTAPGRYLARIGLAEGSVETSFNIIYIVP